MMIESPTSDACPEDRVETCASPPQPERPCFFPGQQLGPSDLNQIVAWADARLRLHRWREGWGVACGLDVQVKILEGKPKLLVYPGYAVSGLGEDVVLRRPLCKSLLDFLDLPRLAECDGEPTQQVQEPVVDKPRLVFDVLLRHRDLVADMRCISPYPPRRPRPARPVRKRESGTIELRKIALPEAQLPDASTMDAAFWIGVSSLAEKSEAERVQWRDAFAEKIERALASRSTSSRRRAFQSARSGSMSGDDAYLASVAKLILLWQELRGDPRDACRGLIPLARVRVFADENEFYGRFEVDEKPPYRRPLGHASAVPAGATDLRPYLGASWNLNELYLGSLNIAKLEFKHPPEAPGEERFASTWIDTGEKREREALVALVHDFANETAKCPEGRRILGFFKALSPEPELPAEPTPEDTET